MEQRMWTPQDAQKAVGDWYEALKAAYNASDWDAVAALYNDDSLVYARDSKIAHIGRRKIKKFWKGLVSPRFRKMTSVSIVIQALHPASAAPVRHQGPGKVVQQLYWTGIMSFEKAKDAQVKSDLSFSGNGGHLDLCAFTNPNFEDYPL